MSDESKAAEPYVLTAEDLWALNTYDFTVLNGPGGRPCVMKLRRLDLLTQLMEDVVNAPLLKAAMAVIKEVQDWMKDGDGRTFESAFENLDARRKRTVLEQLQHFAVTAVLTPKLAGCRCASCAMADARPVGTGEFPVTLLSADTLFAIWNYTPPQATLPRLSEVAATEFRDGARDGADQSAPDGGGVRPAAVGVGPVGGRPN